METIGMQGLPLGSGMGSSAASAAAGAWAVNSLFGSPLSKQDLVPAGLASEAIVSGYHADNIAPALLGGFVLIRCGLRMYGPVSSDQVFGKAWDLMQPTQGVCNAHAEWQVLQRYDERNMPQ